MYSTLSSSSSLYYYYYYYYYIGPPSLPVSINNITIEPTDDSSLFMNWTEQQRCIHHYNITIISNETCTKYNTASTLPATIPSLIIGTNYSFIIIPIDTIGREGPPSSLIQYIWNGKNYTHTHTHTLIVFLIVPAQVVNISWYQISTDSITIWWNEVCY